METQYQKQKPVLRALRMDFREKARKDSEMVSMHELLKIKQILLTQEFNVLSEESKNLNIDTVVPKTQRSTVHHASYIIQRIEPVTRYHDGRELAAVTTYTHNSTCRHSHNLPMTETSIPCDRSEQTCLQQSRARTHKDS
jgi:hypothetical protein